MSLFLSALTQTLVDQFRGIGLISVINKCFCEVIRQRLTSWADRNHKLPPAQFGFRKGHSTVDKLFVLSALTQRAKKLKEPLYSILVDFRKAFDSIKHDLLWIKLQKMGVSTRIILLLKNMYRGINSAVQIPGSNDLTCNFTHHQGDRQGCILSPLLFNLFLSDLDSSLQRQGCRTVKLMTTDVRCLMFADDLVVVTESGRDLQKVLQALEEYCTTWGLSINVEKTKIIIFRRSPCDHGTDFKYQERRVKQVKSHKYLGLMISGTGGIFRQGINQFQQQAKRSTFRVLRHLRKLAHGRLPVETLCHAFQTLILPIMTYAAEVWAYDVRIAYKKMMTAIQMKFLKYALGVGRPTPNAAVLLELGEYPIE